MHSKRFTADQAWIIHFSNPKFWNFVKINSTKFLNFLWNPTTGGKVAIWSSSSSVYYPGSDKIYDKKFFRDWIFLSRWNFFDQQLYYNFTPRWFDNVTNGYEVSYYNYFNKTIYIRYIIHIMRVFKWILKYLAPSLRWVWVYLYSIA